MIDAQERIHNLFEACISFKDFNPQRFNYDIRCFRPNENRDHVEFHFMGCADITEEFPIHECRTYVVHVYPDRNTIRCRINIVKHKDDIDVEVNSRRWRTAKKQGKKARREHLERAIEKTDETFEVLSETCLSEQVLGEHILVECRRRGIYFGWGDVP